MGAKYLASLRGASFHEVEKIYKEALMVYKAIENLKGNPVPLKCKVERYVSIVQSFIALDEVAAKRQCPDELEKEIALCKEQVSQA